MAPELTATILTLMLPLPLSDGSRVRHLLSFTLRIAPTIAFFEGRLGPLFLAGALPKGSVLLDGDLPRRMLFNKLDASPPLDFDGVRAGEDEVLRLRDVAVVLRLGFRFLAFVPRRLFVRDAIAFLVDLVGAFLG